MDGAYIVDRVERTADGTVIHLRDEPVMKVGRGESFRLPTFGLLTRQALATGDTAHLYRLALAAWGQVTAADPGRYVFVRGETGNWRQVDATRNGDAVTVRLDPATFSGGRARVLLTDQPIDLGDVAPPNIELFPSPPVAGDGSFELGFKSNTRGITLRVSDGARIGGLEYLLTGRRAGNVNAQLVREDRLPGLVYCRLDLTDVPDDAYTLIVVARDVLGNDARCVVHFQTEGLIHPFTGLAISEDSGKLSKPLGSLDTQFYRATQVGDFVSYEFNVDESGEYSVGVVFTQADSYGIWQLSIDGESLGKPVNGYNPSVVAGGGVADLDTLALSGGRHTIRAEVTGKDDRSEGYFVGLHSLRLKPR